MPSAWRICIDTGGTFTDGIARDPHGRIRRIKVLSSGGLRGRLAGGPLPGNASTYRVESAPHVDLTGLYLRIINPDPSEGHGGSAINTSRHVRQGQWHSIIAHDQAAHTVELGRPLPFAPAGAVFEAKPTAADRSAGDGPGAGAGEAVVLAAHLLTGTPIGKPLPPIDMRLATTRGTNALLERAGEPVALFITSGFEDLLEIGDQQRPDLFALNVLKRSPLHRLSIGVRERLAPDGAVLTPLDDEALAAEARCALAQGITHAAIAFMHSYRNAAHEGRAAAILRAAGFAHVSCSSELAPLIELLPRAETTVVDAFLVTAVGSFLDDVSSRVSAGGDGRLHVMTSAGGLVRAEQYRAKDSLLSGPAGGVAGAAAAGRASGFTRIIGFDMGGTSTDVARIDGDYEYRFEHTVGEARIVAPALAIETVAAGGGSICGYADDRLYVGPRSAGADPGPACYGASSGEGPLTLTDVNLLLGRLDSSQFEIPIDHAAAEAAFEALRQEITATTGAALDNGTLLEGFLEIANQRMADAIEQISLRKGYDPAEYALLSFGGAGGQHACALAARLGMTTVIMPADASILSAVGLDEAVIERFSQRQVLDVLENIAAKLPRWLDECEADASRELTAEGVPPESIIIRRRIANLRLLGQDATIDVEIDPDNAIASMLAAFNARYIDLYGHAPRGRPIELESIRVIASAPPPPPRAPHGRNATSRDRKEAVPDGRGSNDHPPRRMRARFAGAWIEAPAFDRESLDSGTLIEGPALIFERRSSYVIEPGWTARVDDARAIVATQRAATVKERSLTVAARPEAQPDLVRLELFTSRFAAIADEMGQILQRSALSTNVKRRLDFSCAVLDASGELVVNAPHIPVHLGALGMCVRAAAQAIDIKPGDVIVTNHPAFGGSHLPDLTLITPVHINLGPSRDRQGALPDGRGSVLIGYIANRAHHAEIGGTRPGSMPPFATALNEEGVVIPPMHLVREGEARFDDVENLLRAGPHPSRAVDENLADLRAALAANRRGAASLQALAIRHGGDEVASHMRALKKRAARLAHKALRGYAPDGGMFEAEERLDDGSPLRVSIRIDDGRAVIDFTGSAPQHPGNLNATPAIVRSAVLYVLRLLIGERLPLNEGIMQAVEIVLPRPCILNPDFNADPAPAVVGGNTETSQRLVDALLKALGVVACSQGTMNNLLFGAQDGGGYYETICGGAGAGPGFHGAHAVHTHMTNTRITDPEVIEHRHRVRIDRFAVRRGSGGAGAWRGGDGAIREIMFLENLAVSILSQHRVERPYGACGGEPGATGRQRIERAGGEVIELASIDQCDAQPGDRLVIETPGGGGWGKSHEP